MSKIEEIKAYLEANFAEITPFLQMESRQEFAITDFKGQSYIIISNDENEFVISINGIETRIEGFDESKNFVIQNVKTVVFIPIDGKNGLLGFGDSHCDFVLFDENDCCFVEFKLNGTSASPKTIRQRRYKAVRQLSNTIEFFDEKTQRNYKGLNLEAYICTPEFYPRLDASWRELAQDFLENHGIPLFEENNKICK